MTQDCALGLKFWKNYNARKNYTFRLTRAENTYNLYEFENGIWYNFRLINRTFKYRTRVNDEFSSNQLLHAFSVGENQDLLIASTSKVIRNYLSDEGNLTKTYTTNIKRNWNEIIFGRFCHDPSDMGAIVVLSANTKKLFKIGENSFIEIVTNEKIFNEFCQISSKIEIAHIKKELKQMIVQRSSNCLCFFELTAGYVIRFVGKTSFNKNLGININDKIFFANLSGQENWMDMIIFNTKGMFLFEYNGIDSSEMYNLINYNPMFSLLKGWTNEHTETIHFVDIDNDGFDNMIFTGPGGIEVLAYNAYTRTWTSLLRTEDLSPIERHSNVLHVFEPEQQISNASMITSSLNVIHFATIIKKPKEKIKFVPLNRSYQKFLRNCSIIRTLPQGFDKETSLSLSTIYLRDQAHLFENLQTIDPERGQPYFALPLIGEGDSMIKFHLFYSGNDMTNEFFGFGWSSPQNFIVCNYKSGNFEEDESYVLVIDSFPHKLKTKTHMNFESEYSTKIRAKFLAASCTWYIDNEKGEKLIFGLLDEDKYGLVITDLSWSNWRGYGFDANRTIERPKIWYLAGIESKGITSFYEYETIRSSRIEEKDIHITAVYLKNIFNIFGQLNFFYYNYSKNVNGNKSILLSGYNYQTKFTTQAIHFVYSMASDYLLLTEISQKVDNIYRPVIRFEYFEALNGRYALEKIVLPTGTQIIYNYTQIGKLYSKSEKFNRRKIRVSDDFTVNYGPGFTLISYIHKELKKVILRMFNDETSEEIYPSSSEGNKNSTKGIWPSIGKDVNAYEILLGNSFLAVVVYSNHSKTVDLFGKGEANNWKLPEFTLDYSEETTILKGYNFIIISDPFGFDFNVFEWVQEKYEWQFFSKPLGNTTQRAIAVHDTKFLVYDDRKLFLGYKNGIQATGWILTTLLNSPGFLHRTEEVLSKFNLNTDFQKALFSFFRNNALQLSHNLVVLSTLDIRNRTEFITEIKLFTIGRNYIIANRFYTEVFQDNISSLESEKMENDNGTIYTLKYSYDEENEIKIVLADFQNSTGIQRNQFNEQILASENSPAKHFFLDLKNYFVHFNGQTVECRNVKLTFGGTKWHRSELDKNTYFNDSQSIVLGNSFTVNKTNAQSTVKLYDAANKFILFDFGVFELDEVQIYYPIYIASQRKGKPVTIIEFEDSKEAKISVYELPESEILSPFGYARSLATHRKYSQGGKMLSIWQIYDIRRFLPDTVVTSVKTIIPTSGESKERITGYVYEEKYARLITNAIHYSQVTVMPGNETKSFGYFTITAKSVEYFNGENELVKRIQKDVGRKSEQTDDINQGIKETSLYCRNNHFEIADFAPFSAKSDMSAFIGFEDYELTADNWNFSKSEIIAGKFSLTGKNYLKLDDGNSFSGIFQPNYQDRQFVASCWIRTVTEMIPRLGDIVPYLRATIFTQGRNDDFSFLSDVKYQIGDWSYLEVSFDLEVIKLTLEDVNLLSKDLQVEIRISSMLNVSLHLDNVRFSPLNNIFDVKIYDEGINKVVAIIKSNGAITRQFYDKYLVKNADINESNQIEEFMTYSKYMHNKGRFHNPASSIKLIPEKGFYEDFSPINFCSRWALSNVHSWNVSPSLLEHYENHKSKLELNCEDIDINSHGIRFLYSIANESSIFVSYSVKLKTTNGKAEIFVLDYPLAKQTIPVEGEILLIREGNRTIVWINGNLFIDQHSFYSKLIEFVVEGKVKIEQMIVLSRSQVQVTYKNSLGEEIQHISLASDSTAIIKEMLHDSLGRQRITVQPAQIYRLQNQSLVAYASNFVSNDNPNDVKSVWKTGKLKGEIEEICGHEFAYSEVVYDNSPLNIKTRIGMPGKEFSSNGPYAQHFGSTTTNKFVQKQYSHTKNFVYKVQEDAFGNKQISIFNDLNLKVAVYFDTLNERDIFSTFHYNEMGFMIKFRPPMFYFKYGIFATDSMDLTGLLYNMPTEHPWETRIEYDRNGNPTRKMSPDMGTLENVYDDKDRLRFIIQYLRSTPEIIEFMTYLIYDSLGRLISTGSLKPPFYKSHPFVLNISQENTDEFQRFYYSDNERDPSFRGKILRSITIYANEANYEESIHDFKDNSIEKRYILPNGSDKPQILSINKRYEGGLLKEIIYPASMFGEIFRVSYKYDRLGRIISVGVPGQKNRFLSITYNANNQIMAENFLPLHIKGFVRTYKYNEPGYLIEINDLFLREEISYLSGGGTVVRVKFTSKWYQSHTGTKIELKENSFESDEISLLDSKNCFLELQRKGYLNKYNQQINIFDPNQSLNSSSACAEGRMKIKVRQVMEKYRFPEEFGFRFEYGPFMELKKAKYFITLNSNIFSENMLHIDGKQSKNIWNILLSNGYIIQDTNGDVKIAKAIVRESLYQDLYRINPKLENYRPLIEKLLLNQFTNQRTILSLSEVEEIFVEDFPNKTVNAKNIHEMLSEREYLSKPIKPHLIEILKDFKSRLPEIIGIIQSYIVTGQSDFDVDSNEIDANGNYVKFHVGYKSYELDYGQNSNRIVMIKTTLENGTARAFPVEHDNRGNIIKAIHKNIDLMEYHPISNRLQYVKMTNGDNIVFKYDSKGERLLKRVTDQNKRIKSEMFYIRDNNGRTLVEKKVTFLAENQNPDILVTVYIYGPKAMIGFIRRDKFYSVFTDHQGSIRLVILDGEVVAAYDYMPYGSTFRIYGSCPNAHILYRYTGQEWDPELELYNYHARLYDPSIRRFYQIDPMTQYFSPYKYAGNSPVSMVDPSGTVAIPFLLLVVGFTLLGAYLSGAAINNDFNVLKWKWSRKDTQLAIFIGGVTGFLMPIGFSGSLAVLSALSISTIKAATITTSIGLFTAYISMSARSGSWIPGNWRYTSPKTWWAAFEGLSVGFGIISGFNEAFTKFALLNTHGRYLLGVAISTYSAESFVMNGISNSWNFKNPALFYSFMKSVISTIDFTVSNINNYNFLKTNVENLFYNIRRIELFILKMQQNLRRASFSTSLAFQLDSSIRSTIKVGGRLLFGTTSHIIAFGLLMGLLMGDVTQWSFIHLSTYHTLLNVLKLEGMALNSAQIAISSSKTKLSIPTIRRHSFVLKTLRSFVDAITAVSRSARKFSPKSPLAVYTSFSKTITFPTSSELAFSFNESNIKIVYTYKRFTNPFFYVRNANSTDKSQSISLPKDNLLLQKVNKAIINVEIELRKIYKNKLILEIIPELQYDNKTLGIVHENGQITKQFEDILEKLLESNDLKIDRDSILITMENNNIHSPTSDSFKSKYLAKEQELLSAKENLSKNLDFHERYKLLRNIKYLEIAIKNLKWKENIAIFNLTETVADMLWTKIKNYQNQILKWEASNCAEPPMMFLPTFVREFQSKFYPNPKSYESSQDLMFLSSFKLEEIPQLTGFTNCFTCISATTKTRTKVRDIVWLTMLNEKFIATENITNKDDKKRDLFQKRRQIRSIDKEQPKISPQYVRGTTTNVVFMFKKMMDQFRCIWRNSIFQRKSNFLTSSPIYSDWKNETFYQIQFEDEYLSKMTTNENLLLIDVFLAKYGKRKIYSSASRTLRNFNILTQQEFACVFINLYDEFLSALAKASRIGDDLLNKNNMYELYEILIDVASTKSYEKIFDLLTQYAFMALSHNTMDASREERFSKLQQFEKFLKSFNLKFKIDEILIKYSKMNTFQ